MGHSYQDRLLRVIDYIHDNLDGDLSLDTLADIACMSRFHWHRVFRGMTGETVAQAVRRIRLHKASMDLIATDEPIPAIAERFGYPNVASFTRAFATAYGLPPGAFRERGEARRLELLKRSGDGTMFPVKTETYPELTLAAVPHKGPYDEISVAFEQAIGIFTSRNLLSHWAGLAGVYGDDPDIVAPEDLRSYAGVILADPASFPMDIEGLELLKIPAGKFAVMEHKGPYATLREAYGWFFGTWLPESGEEVGDQPCVEVYLNDPRETAPEDLRTDVRMAVA
ncbi:MAG: AraC family transcriptional regulator [Pseudomonadota bacterium]